MAQVAQLVEQRTENPRVGGSIPPLGTIFFKHLDIMFMLHSEAQDCNTFPLVLNGSRSFSATRCNTSATFHPHTPCYFIRTSRRLLTLLSRRL
jgi:hypothetical protein